MDFREENFSEETKSNDSEKGAATVSVRTSIVVSLLLVFLAVLITFVVTYAVLTVKYTEQTEQLKDAHKQELDAIGEFKTIAELFNALPKEMQNIDLYKKLAYLDYYYRTSYVGELDEEKLMYGLAAGYVIGTEDKYGSYYTANEFDTVLGDTEGNSVGIGVYVTIDSDSDNIRISYVMKDGPANKVGLLPGDLVTHVEGTPVTELGYYGAIDRIKGEAGTSVEITYVRGGQSYNVTLVRESITVESVIYTKHQTEQGVGIIRIIEFNNATPAQFEAAVKQAIEVDKCHTLVYDLRGNPGGTLSSVIDMLDFLLPSGPMVTVRYADGTKYTYSSDDLGSEFEGLYGKDVKMAILTNGYTASAAELFTCALKDYKKAIVVGEQTYGKGCGQSVIPLPDGTGLAFTTFFYDPPVSENYNGVGIEPDVKKELSEEASNKNIFELSHQEDDQLKAALEALK